MTGKDFWAKVHADDRLEYLGSKEGKTPAEDVVFVKHQIAEGRNLKFAVEIQGILAASWEDLLAVFLGKRQPKVIKHVTRIVGYYSYTYCWNKSKLAELADRRKGNYAVPEAA